MLNKFKETIFKATSQGKRQQVQTFYKSKPYKSQYGGKNVGTRTHRGAVNIWSVFFNDVTPLCQKHLGNMNWTWQGGGKENLS